MVREQMAASSGTMPDVHAQPRMIFDADVVQAEWEDRYGGTGPAPPAWIDSNGNIVVDATRVNVYEGEPSRHEE